MPVWVKTWDRGLVNLDNADAITVRARPGPGSTREHPVPLLTIAAKFGEKEIVLRKDISEEDMNTYMAWLYSLLGVKEA